MKLTLEECLKLLILSNPWYINVFQIRWFTRGGGMILTPLHIFYLWTEFDDFFSEYSSSCLVSKTYRFFSSFWLTVFLVDFYPTFFRCKIDAWDNRYWNYIDIRNGNYANRFINVILWFFEFLNEWRHRWRHMGRRVNFFRDSESFNLWRHHIKIDR